MLNHLPDPFLGPGDHYKKFTEVFGTKAIKEHMQTFKQEKVIKRQITSITC